MKKHELARLLSSASWILLAFSTVFMFITVGITYDSAAVLILVSALLLIGTFLATTYLLIQHRSLVRTGRGWVILLLALVASSYLVFDSALDGSPRLAAVFTLLYPNIVWALLVSTVMYLWHRDVGLCLSSLGILFFLWTVALIWRSEGNLIERSLNGLLEPVESSILWWWAPISCVIWWIVPAGIISFIAHTLRLILVELGPDDRSSETINHGI
jgi:hypothetical protein